MQPHDDHLDHPQPCGACENGNRLVTDAWARQEAGIPQDADLDVLRRVAAGNDETPGDSVLADRLAKYAALANTAYPCPTCRPAQFARWRNGCFAPNHNRKVCQLCQAGR